MGNHIFNDKSIDEYKMNFQDIQHVLKHSESFLLINTLNINEQNCILQTTIKPEVEVDMINELIKTGKKHTNIVVYGKNCNDTSVLKKQEQLKSLGFSRVYVYIGGMFEWLLLQDIYSETEFPTTKKEFDILKFKSERKINQNQLNYRIC
jgi:rhodanese-related sulfurtransferase